MTQRNPMWLVEVYSLGSLSIAPGEDRAVEPATRGVLPLGLGGQLLAGAKRPQRFCGRLAITSRERMMVCGFRTYVSGDGTRTHDLLHGKSLKHLNFPLGAG
jgi:hypothetical protein